MPSDSRLRWIRALAAGVGAEVLTILTIVLAVKVFHANTETAGLVLGAGGGIVFTFLMALWAAGGVDNRYVLHGLITAIGAVVVHLIGLAGAPGGFRPIYAIADLCKLIAGAIAGVVVSRRR